MYTCTILLFRYVGNYPSRPPADISQDITSTSAFHENGVTTVTFTREIVTGDSNDVRLDQCVYFLYAWGGSFDINTQAIEYHGSNTREASSTLICLPPSMICTSKCITPSWLVCMSVTPPLVWVLYDVINGTDLCDILQTLSPFLSTLVCPCENGGSCIANSSSICVCPPGYTGQYCEQPLCKL